MPISKGLVKMYQISCFWNRTCYYHKTMRNNHNVLILENNYIARKLLDNYFHKFSDLKLFFVATALKAFDVLNELGGEIDVFFVDLDAASEGGFDFLKYALLHKKAVFIVVGDLNGSELKRLMKQKNRLVNLSKPFPLEQLDLALAALPTAEVKIKTK
jgi:hypothetical protein